MLYPPSSCDAVFVVILNKPVNWRHLSCLYITERLSLSVCFLSIYLAVCLSLARLIRHLVSLWATPNNLLRWEHYLWALLTSFIPTPEFILTQHSALTTSPYIVSLLSHLNEFVISASLVFVLWSSSLIPIGWCQCAGLLWRTSSVTQWLFLPYDYTPNPPPFKSLFLFLSFVLHFL